MIVASPHVFGEWVVAASCVTAPTLYHFFHWLSSILSENDAFLRQFQNIFSLFWDLHWSSLDRVFATIQYNPRFSCCCFQSNPTTLQIMGVIDLDVVACKKTCAKDNITCLSNELLLYINLVDVLSITDNDGCQHRSCIKNPKLYIPATRGLCSSAQGKCRIEVR